MAQHIPTRNFSQQVIRNIENGIRKDVKRGYLSTSMKYETLPSDYYNNEDNAVYVTNRYVGKGFVYGSNRADFEIHCFGKEVNAIYLVA